MSQVFLSLKRKQVCQKLLRAETQPNIGCLMLIYNKLQLQDIVPGAYQNRPLQYRLKLFTR
jgi:hypothetical protein